MNSCVNESAGSYDFGTFAANDRELSRLERQGTAAQEVEREIWVKAGLRPGMRVLDLACGPGTLSCALADFVADGEVVGVDLSEKMIATARRRQEAAGVRNLKFQCGDVYSLDAALGQFDFVYSRFLFQHLREPILALNKICRVLKPEGTLCVLDVDDTWLTFVPCESSFQEFTRLAVEGQRQKGGDRYIGRKLGMLFKQAGLTNVSTSVSALTSDELGVKPFLDITTSFKLEQIDPSLRAKGQALLDEIYGAVDDPLAWGAVGVFVASGQLRKNTRTDC